MILRILIVGAFVIVGVLPGTVSGAQTFSNPNPSFPQQPQDARPTGPLGIDVNLGVARDDDYIGLDNAYSSGDVDYTNELGNAIADALDVPRSRSNVGEDFDDFSYDYSYETVISIEDRVTTKNGSDRSLEIDSSEIARIARTWEYESVDLSVCSPLPLDDESSRAGSVDDDCRAWTFATATGNPTQPGQIRLVQQTDVEGYWTLVGVSAAVVAILTVLFSATLLALRRGPFKYFGGGVLALIGAFTFFGTTAWGVGAIVFAVVERPVSDYIVANDLGSGGAFVAHVLPSLLYSLPFVGAALVLARATPRPAAATTAQADGPSRAAQASPAPAPAMPGVPGWLDQPSRPSSTTPKPKPEVEQQSQRATDDGDGDGPSWRAPS